MELQALLVLCGLGVAGVAVLLLMGLFSTSGTSYEEAMAQQRRAAIELLALAENKNKVKKTNSKKANKKLAKKEKNKESATAATGSEQESEAPAESGVEDDPIPTTKTHVEFSPPVVVDIKDTPPNVKIRKRGKDSKVKPILLNKEDPSCVSDPSAVPVPADVTVVNHFEEMHPKDEFELLQSSLAADKAPEKSEEVAEKKDNKPSKSTKSGKVAAKPQPSAELVKEELPRERHNSGDASKDTRKGKKVDKKVASSEVVDAVREEVVPPLNVPQPIELTTEKLLKQALAAAPATAPAPAPAPAPPAAAPAPAPAPTPAAAPAPATTKNKKKKAEPNVLTLMAGDSGGVNVGELVRVVRDAALSRTEIQILTDALLNKHHDPLPQHSEWTEGPNDPVQKLKKQLADKEKALSDEVEASQALQAKLKELRAALNAERARAAAAARGAEQQRARADHAAADAHAQQARLQRLADDNMHLQSKLSAEGEAAAQRVQMEVHIQRLSESEGALVAQLAALQAELSALALEAGQARCELAAAQQHAADLAQQLQDSARAYAELDQLTQQDRRQGQDRILELQNEVQRLANRAQTAESNVDKLKEESEQQQQQLLSQIATLGEQLAARETELAELKQLKAVSAQNGLPVVNESEQQKAAELAKVESVVAALRGELAAAQRGARDQRDQLAALADQLRLYRDKNNELRTKNWKVMEALQSAEKALQMKSATALPAQDSLRDAILKAQEAQYNEVANVLRAVYPSAAPASSPGKQWLQAFADNLKSELEKKEQLVKQSTQQEVDSVLEVSSAPSDERVGELVAQNEHLQSLVDKYKRIIDDTEGVLSRLQQNVTKEEQRWAHQLAEKQRELDELRQRTILQMQKKIDALQAELQQAHGANENHTLADVERFTQERLMADLSNKHVDACNGPLQMELTEK